MFIEIEMFYNESIDKSIDNLVQTIDLLECQHSKCEIIIIDNCSDN